MTFFCINIGLVFLAALIVSSSPFLNLTFLKRLTDLR